jgi:hypothetical protein
MAVDIRATVTCSLGTVISGNISDSYIQGKGLITVQGQVEINGLITPTVGTAVTFAYKRNGGTRNIPRKLRVLSSFADPFRRTTKVQLGCKLAYLADKKEQLTWDAYSDPQNDIDYYPEDYTIIGVPIHAASLMDHCLTELGITASSNPLTNRFSIPEFSFASGYVAALNDLLVSEGYCGYLDRNEVLQVFALNQDGGTGPVVGTGQIIDLTSINAGQLPGESVVVSYTTMRLKGTPSTVVDWTTSKSSDRSSVSISYTDPVSQSQQSNSYSTLDTTEETSDFQTLIKASTKEKVSVLRYRKIVKTESSPKVLGSVMVQFLQVGIAPATAQLRTVTEEWFYYDQEANEVRTVRETYASKAYAYGSVSVPVVFEGAGGVVSTVTIPYGSTYLQEATETETTVLGNFRKIVTRRYGPWMATMTGQQAIAEGRDSLQNATQVENYMNRILDGKHLLKLDIHTEESTSSGQRVPSQSQINSQQNAADNSNPSNSNRVDSKSELALALGSATSQRRVEFSLPLAPDDSYSRKVGGGYEVITGNAYSKAVAFGRIQNRLLLANRAGMNLQLSAVHMPETPFSPLVVQANGLSGLYRTNGTNWSFSAEGLVVSTEALFWGAVGGTGDFWFPVAPGVTSLPTTPGTTTTNITGTSDGGSTVTIGTQTTMVVPGTVAPFNEAVVLAPTTRTRLVVSSLPYGLTSGMTSVTLTTKTKLSRQQPINISNIVYSQSSVYSSNTAATNATMTNGLLTGTATGTNSATLSWIKMDMGAEYEVDRIIVGTATSSLPGGWDKSYTENAAIEYSIDNATWTSGGSTGTFATNGIFEISVSFSARYIRISKQNDYLALTELYPLAPEQSYP